jgi:ABC-type multidrug transport system fused ATPase/permease subunit
MGTIRENLLFGNKDASEKDCLQALKQANATFVEELENGLDTLVGTANSIAMSGG